MNRMTAAFVATIALATTGALAQERSTAMKIDSKKPIQIESNRLEVRDADNVAIFTGNVAVQQEKTLMKSAVMKVFYKKKEEKKDGEKGAKKKKEGDAESTDKGQGAADIDRLEVSGTVYVKSETQEATGDNGVYDMNTETLVLNGFPHKPVVLTEGKNVIIGCRLTVNTKTGLANLAPCAQNGQPGRVKMLLTPGDAQKKDGAGEKKKKKKAE
ncbi:MAG: LPS ABC transporter substrate-binding protein LptA [Notoacmeibacter sp.]|nr:LPS ABC transporter substrate-binding protein LptA [Notoacmeibacter sp.]MCC0032392.1 LPS ABC transporter substrate-binding protein LptA [Brucellaceae bacterium]